jgi:hypothetical protein
MFFRPGLKYINSFEFRELGAANEPKQPISGALSTARTLSASKSNRLPIPVTAVTDLSKYCRAST